jgi:2-C-methyl-D-erythritol 2,4-cyclodiphosphate synthase
VGTGFDVHRLVAGRRCIIGGVDIPFERGLDGHSDADVLVHAVMDALLGAAGLKDIGNQFPDNDPSYKNIDSLVLLAKVGALLKEQGWQIENIDSVVMCEQPKLAGHIDSMKRNIAAALGGIDQGCVGVKATTTEKLGFTGRGEGIASQAVVLLSAQ